MPNVLVVDDNVDLLFIIEEYLNMNGIECDTATSVSRARKNLVHRDYDMVVSDLEMPGESGLELFRFLSFTRPKLPFLLMSGSLDSRTRHQARKMGICRFLEKPFELRVLKRMILSLAPCETQAGIGAPAA